MGDKDKQSDIYLLLYFHSHTLIYTGACRACITKSDNFRRAVTRKCHQRLPYVTLFDDAFSQGPTTPIAVL